jgi:uncharacterized protein YfdQ (DUF2303 family)
VAEEWSETLSGDYGDAAAIIAAARASAGVQARPIDPEAEPLVLVREQGTHGTDKVQVVSLEPWRQHPARLKGTVHFDQPASLEAYVNEFKETGTTRLYASIVAGQVVALFNDDEPTEAQWRDHRAELALVRTPEWCRWREQDGRMDTQVAFAEFLELNMRNVVDPDAATLIEIARSFTASSEVAFRSAHDLQSGEIQFAYDEQVTATAGDKKQIAIPRTFTLSLRPYRGMDPVPITARLRYRLKNGNLTIGYILDDPQEVEEEAFEAVLDGIGLRTGVEPLFGHPAGPR